MRALGLLFCSLAALNAQHNHSAASYARSVHDYAPPAVTLVDAKGQPVKLDALLAAPRPVLLQFVFTSCTTICPILSATFSSVQDGLGPGVRLVSISIDPEYDTPARLAAYAARFRARPQWTFLTGSANNIAIVERSFDVETNGKMNHLPVTFLRAAPGQPWVRIEGLTSASELLTEYRYVAR